MQTSLSRWTATSREKRFRTFFAASIVLLIAILTVYRMFLEHVEGRPGVVLDDPVLSLITPRDLTWLTFSLVYGGILYAGIILLRHPIFLLRTMNAYSAMVLLRMLCMFSAPLDPPIGTILLKDPVVEWFGGSGATLTRDLFFSGHVATLCLLGLAMPLRVQRLVLLSAAGATALCVMFQHVHYTIDVIIAPLAAFVSIRAVDELDLMKKGKIR